MTPINYPSNYFYGQCWPQPARGPSPLAVALVTAAIAPIVVAVLLACAVQFALKGSPK